MNQKQNLNCKICSQNGDWTAVATIKNHRKNLNYSEFIYYQCPNCSFWQLTPELTKDELYQIYQTEEYYQELSQEVSSPIQKILFNIKIYPGYDEFVSEYLPKDKSLLDIGSGNGEFLKSMQQRGFQVTGIDPYPVAIKQTSEKIGSHNVHQGYIKDLPSIPKNFDAITMWHVLEHVDNPIDDLKVINSKLNNSGKLIFEVPNANSLPFRLFKNDYCWNMVPEHINYFTPKSIEEALKITGYQKIKIYTPPRALLNFALSIKNILVRQKFPSLIIKVVTLVLVPLSIVIGIISSYFDKGEVIRVVAQKK